SSSGTLTLHVSVAPRRTRNRETQEGDILSRVPRLHLRKRAPETTAACPLPHERSELIEEILTIVRAGRGFGVVLDAENRKTLVTHALGSVVIEIDVKRNNDPI